MELLKKQFNSLDLGKFIFAIVVVTIHTQPFEGVSETFNWYYLQTFCNLAVPFFFVTSGFLLFRNFDKLTEDARRSKVKKYVLHILQMYGVWCVIWLPWKALNFYNLGHLNLTDLLCYIRDIIFVSGGDALWYLPALAFSVLIVYALLKKIHLKFIVVIGACLYAVGIAISSWYGLFSQFGVVRLYYLLFSTTSNGLLYGILFTAIGAYIGGAEQSKRSYIYMIGFAASFIGVILEAFLIKKTGINYNGVVECICVPICIFCLFRLILKIDLKDRPVYRELRAYSTLIYLSHCFVIRCLKMMYAVFKINVSSFVHFGVVLLISVLFSMVVICLSKNRKWKYLKILY